MANPTTPMKPNSPFPESRKGSDFKDSIGGRIDDAKEKVEEKAESLTEKAKSAASAVGQKASEAASAVAHGASNAASAVSDKVDEGLTAVGGGMTSLAGTIRDKGPHEGAMSSATTSVAESLESGGKYLQEQGLSGMADDLTDVIRKHPIPALLVAIGIGFMVARATRS
jgi:hypothetical protein